jgi:hypothetical protein
MTVTTTRQADSLVLDIGDGIGALILYAPEDALDAEIDVSRHGDGYRTHTIIRRRQAGGRTVSAGVYPSLGEGVYDVWSLGGAVMGTVVVQSGHVAALEVSSVR